MTRMFDVMRVALVALLAITIPAAASAQITRGALVGTVRDASGGVVPGVTVTVTNLDTNAARVAVTDEQGAYRVGALEPGRYKVTTELSGFAPYQQTDVTVRSALDTSIDITIRAGSISEAVTVTADASSAALNRTNPTIGTTINARAIEQLPLPGGRNINNLILTVPNASSTTGQGTYAVNGNRPRNNNYMVDGSDNNDISVTLSTSQIVPEAVAEFQVLQNPYSVEFGRNSGGQINVITKSGSNAFRGDAWDYYQASGLNSRNNLEKNANLPTQPKNIRHQVGGDLGGPVYRDRLFFYGNFQRDSTHTALRPSGTAVTIPTQAGFAALAGVPLADGQPASSRQAVLSSLGFLSDIYATNPAFTSLNNTTVNGVAIQTGVTNVMFSDPSLYYSYLGRMDFRAGTNDTFTVRYSLNDRQDAAITSNLGFGSLFAADQTTMDSNIAVSNTHVFGARMLNETRFSLVGRELDFPENDGVTPTAQITGLFTIGGLNNFPQSRVSKSWQFSDTLTWTLARHSLKFGTDIRYNDVDNVSGFNSKGFFQFNNLQDYMNNQPTQVTQALQTAGWIGTQWQTGFFVQDDFRVTPDLTLNMGIRYELAGVPLGLFGATDSESLSAGVPGPVKMDTNNWAPRVGFAWTPNANNWLLGDRKSVLRGGFGMAYDVIFYNLLIVSASNYPRIVSLNETDLARTRDLYPTKLTGSATPVFNPLAQWVNSQETTENPESRFYSASWQREVGRYVFELGYSGSRGSKGINQVEANPAILTAEQAALVASTQSAASIPTAQSRRLNPAIGSRILIPATVGPNGSDVDARSTYNAVFASAQRRLTRSLMVNASYTFSRWMSNNDASLGEGGTDGTNQRPQSMFDYDAEWSRSQYDRPHRFTASYLWEIPGPKDGLLGQVIGGWQLSGVTQGQSGRPFTITTGVDSNGDTNLNSDRPNINPAGSFVWDKDHKSFTNNGYYVAPLGTNGLPLQNALGNGNAPRNSERGAAWWNTDVALMKRFSLPGTVTFTARVDAFNLFNQDNYSIPVGNMSSPSFGQNLQNFGRRIIQLGGKFTF